MGVLIRRVKRANIKNKRQWGVLKPNPSHLIPTHLAFCLIIFCYIDIILSYKQHVNP